MPLSQKQLMGMKKQSVLIYFKTKWEEKYKEKYVMPEDYLGVDRNINLALNNYDAVVIKSAIDEYLKGDKNEWFHPIRFFAKDITYWVMRSKAPKDLPVVNSNDDELTKKHGIVKKGDFYITESGVIFTKLDDAIKAVTNRKKV